MHSRRRVHRHSTEFAIAGLKQGKEGNRRGYDVSLLCMLCVRVAATGTGRPLVQRSPTDCDVSRCVCDLGSNRPVASQKKKRKVILQVHNATVITWCSSEISFICTVY